jgi:hypothetical protein
MPKSAKGCLETAPRLLSAQLAGISAEEMRLQRNLLKLRGVLILLSARHGSKVATARVLADELNAKRVKASPRSIYAWRNRYLRSGFAGIERRLRNDRDYPRGFGQETLTRIVEAATRVQRHGDMAREFRRYGFGISYETFRVWVRRIQRQLRVVEIPEREETVGLRF